MKEEEITLILTLGEDKLDKEFINKFDRVNKELLEQLNEILKIKIPNAVLKIKYVQFEGSISKFIDEILIISKNK